MSKKYREGDKSVDADSVSEPFTSSETSNHKDSLWHFVAFVKVHVIDISRFLKRKFPVLW